MIYAHPTEIIVLLCWFFFLCFVICIPSASTESLIFGLSFVLFSPFFFYCIKFPRNQEQEDEEDEEEEEYVRGNAYLPPNVEFNQV